jgi:hypothetical protein
VALYSKCTRTLTFENLWQVMWVVVEELMYVLVRVAVRHEEALSSCQVR